ncbi:MAG: glycosyltransferase family 4 protein [Clostridiaceae bacterium]|nr:glycosyltransferase family 4 protein [Clostridiaceae bacterium]
MSEFFINAPFLKKKPRFLVILFGTLEYDGRVQRMISILNQLGQVILVDVKKDEKNTSLDSTIFKEITRYSIKIPQKNGRIKRHLQLARAAIRVALMERPHIIVAEDFFTTMTGWLTSKMVHAELIYDAHELIIPDLTQFMSWRDNFWYMLEKWTVHRASLVIAANPERAQLMTQHYKLKNPCEYMLNIPPLRTENVTIQEIERQYPALKRRYPEERIVLYQGYVSFDRGLNRFVEALTYLPLNYRMVVVGDGPDLEHLKAIAEEELQRGRFTVLGRVANHLLPAIIKYADLGIVTYSYEGLNNIYCSPNKIFEYAQAGLPVVATDQPSLRSMVEGYGIGILIRQDTPPQEVAKIIKQVVERKIEYQYRLHKFVQAFRWEDEANRVRERIKEVLVRRGLA